MLKRSITNDYPIKCPCCSEGTIKSLHDVCLVCGWEDDVVQNEDENFSGGANKLSLSEYRQNFRKLREENKDYKWVSNCR